MAIEGVQIKVKFPQHQYDRLAQDAEAAGVPIASVVRMAVADWYKGKDERRQLLQVGHSDLHVTPESVLIRMMESGDE